MDARATGEQGGHSDFASGRMRGLPRGHAPRGHIGSAADGPHRSLEISHLETLRRHIPSRQQTPVGRWMTYTDACPEGTKRGRGGRGWNLCFHTWSWA